MKKIISLLTLTIILKVVLISTMKYDVKEIDFNSVIEDKLQGSKMKFYSITVDKNLKDNDLLIDAKMEKKNGLFDSPIVLASLVCYFIIFQKPLPNTDKKSQWVCGQLGAETCFVPNKYLKEGEKVYIGVLCEECSFTLKTTFLKEELLKDGENKLFHLKAGDKLAFKLDEFFKAETESIQISSFNLKMSKYTMNVQIIDSTSNKVIDVPVNTNWIGGQQAIIKPEAKNYKYEYIVILTAIENGVFNIEARTSNAVIPLDDKTLKFETVKANQQVCYVYNINKANVEGDLMIEAKSIKGDLSLTISPESDKSNTINLTVANEKDIKYTLTSEIRKNKNVQGGNWLICARSNASNHSFFTLQAFLGKNSELVKQYKKLLFDLLKKDEMYDVGNLQVKKSHENRNIYM